MCQYWQVFAELPSLSFVKCASLIGHNNSQEMRTYQMQDTIAKFRDGRVRFISCWCGSAISFRGVEIYSLNLTDVHICRSHCWLPLVLLKKDLISVNAMSLFALTLQRLFWHIFSPGDVLESLDLITS